MLCIIFKAPFGYDLTSILEALEPVPVQALVPKTSVEALDEAVPHGLAWVDKDKLDPFVV